MIHGNKIAKERDMYKAYAAGYARSTAMLGGLFTASTAFAVYSHKIYAKKLKKLSAELASLNSKADETIKKTKADETIKKTSKHDDAINVTAEEVV